MNDLFHFNFKIGVVVKEEEVVLWWKCVVEFSLDFVWMITCAF